MAFGSGALIAAVAYELVQDAFATDFQLASWGFAVGALTFYVGRLGNRPPGRSGPEEHVWAGPACRECQRDRARHRPRRHPRVVRAWSVAVAGERGPGRSRRMCVRIQRPGGAVRNERPARGRLDARSR